MKNDMSPKRPKCNRVGNEQRVTRDTNEDVPQSVETTRKQLASDSKKDQPTPSPKNPGSNYFEKAVEGKSRRKLIATKEGRRSPWFGLGMFGLIGWSIALPTIAGVLLGGWLDANWPSRVSWKLTFLFLGVATGFSVALYWMRKEFSR